MKKKSFLIVDDNTHEAFSIGGVLQARSRALGMSLRVFTDGDEALECITKDREISIDGAIVDLWMVDNKTGIENPNKGEEVIQAIKKYHPTAKVVVLSAHMDEKARENFRQLKMPSFKKPAITTEVFEAVFP